MWQGFWIHLWILTSSFSSMSILAGCFLLKKVTKYTRLFYLFISQKILEKCRKTSVAWSILWKSWDYIPQITQCEIQQRSFTRNFTKVLFTALKYKKALTAILKENLRYKQLRLNYKNSQKKQTYFSRLVTSSIRVGAVTKTDDEFYVSSTIKMYSYFSYVFSTVPKKVQLLKILKVIQLLWKILPRWKNGREEHNKFFGQSLLPPVVF